MGFFVLEDETARIQVAYPPAVADTLRLMLATSSYVAVSGRVERTRWHRSLFCRLVRPLPPDAKVGRHAIAAYGERAQGAGALPA